MNNILHKSNQISQLERLKAWVEQNPEHSVGLVSGVIAAGWLSGLTQLGAHSSNIAAWAVHGGAFAASVTVGMFYSSYKNSLSKEYGLLFEEKSTAKKVCAEISVLMSHIDPVFGPISLQAGMRRLREQVTRENASKPMSRGQSATIHPPTAGGFSIGEHKKLPSDTNEAYLVVEREVLHAYVSFYSEKAYYRSKSNHNAHTRLPSAAQVHIIEYHPDILLINPLLFDDIALEKHTPGMSTVVASLREMSCDAPTVREHVSAWHSNRETLLRKDEYLPDNLVAFR